LLLLRVRGKNIVDPEGTSGYLEGHPGVLTQPGGEL